MKFVTPDGRPWSPPPPQKKHRARAAKSVAPEKELQFLGWEVTGFSPEQVQEARESIERERAAAMRDRNSGGSMKVPPPFDVELWMNGAKPKKIRSKPYSTPATAAAAAELASASGWLRVRVDEKRRGG